MGSLGTRTAERQRCYNTKLGGAGLFMILGSEPVAECLQESCPWTREPPWSPAT